MTQVDILHAHPEPYHLYLQGPPGCGKTIVLLMKALQWIHQQRKVLVVQHPPWSLAVSTLMIRQLSSILGEEAHKHFRLHRCDFRSSSGLDVATDVAQLRHEFPGKVGIIVDEVPSAQSGGLFIPWLSEVRDTWPQAVVWMGGSWVKDNTAPVPSDRLPGWVEVRTMLQPLRCPPSITTHLMQTARRTFDAGLIQRYDAVDFIAHTDGPAVRILKHKDEAEHTGDHPLKCISCADDINEVLKDLRVGESGHSLHYRDVMIITGGAHHPEQAHPMVQRLQRHHRRPVSVVVSALSACDVEEVATAASDHIAVVHCQSVSGLERRVVISLGNIFAAASRCTSLFVYIQYN